jgi:phosphocarrier protein FPr
VAEIQAAKKILEEVRVELDAVGTAYDGRMEVGMMIEVPSAVAVADLLAREVDFFSIGTNDLTQYVMAADRGNAAVAGLVNAMNTAVLRMIRQTVIAGHEAGIWVGLCGELGGNPDASALLVGLGLDELSMNAPSIPAVKARIRELEKGEAEKMAGEMLGNWVVKEKLVNGAAVL